MGVWILYDSDAQRAVFYDSNAEQALPVLSFIGAEAQEQAGSFLAYLCTDHNREAHLAAADPPTLMRRYDDPRSYPGRELEAAHDRWRTLVGRDDGISMNEYGWTLHEWFLMRPEYGALDTLNAAPEPSELDALDDPSDAEVPL